MLLNGNLYQLKDIQPNDNQLIATIKLDEKNEIYQGHFPNNPVTPGVVQLEMIKEILAIQFDRPIHLKSISNCKYLAILDPRKDAIITLTFTINAVDDLLKVSCVLASETTTFTKVQGIYY